MAKTAALFDADYYMHGCGEPYQRSEAWLSLFTGFADRIMADIQPKSLLDAGCALGLLVEMLRDRGVDAFGIDISDYAIQNVREDIQPFCQVASIQEPLPRSYELIVCIEVLEHMPAEEAEAAIANLCSHTDDILFSSSPLDYEEPTHFNVRQPEYWAAQFARHGFVRILEYDASFITPWAMRFQRKKQPVHSLIQDYERHLWPLQKESHDLRNVAVEMRQQLAEQRQQIEQLRQELASQNQKLLTLSTQSNGDLPSQRLLIISHDVIGKKMAGPGIRYYHMALALSQHIETVLAIPDESPPTLQAESFEIVRYRRREWSTIEPYLRQAQICLFPSDAAHEFPELSQSQAYLIVDGYDPLMAEWLALGNLSGQIEHAHWQQRMADLAHQYQIGDFFICASERQRDWWMGLLEASGRINPANFRTDPSLRSLIDVVPYGLPQKAAQKTKAVIKGVWQNIEPTDKLILWGGGLWPWLDPLTAIRAVANIWRTRQDVKLIFPGTKHPNPNLDGLPTQNEKAYALAQELGLLQSAVFFGDWVPYEEWADVLLECDIALTLHYDTVETRLAFRSRVLEYIWAGLPTIATRGDATSDIIQANQIGTIVDYGDVDAITQAIHNLLEEPMVQQEANFQKARERLTWERAIEPLVAFCKKPHYAADRSESRRAQWLHQDDVHQQLGALQHQIEEVGAEAKRWESLVHDYEQGRFIRLMKWAKTNRPFAKR